MTYEELKNQKEDHPHIHGEHRTFHPVNGYPRGSPPYTWGARFPRRHQQNPQGITPIYMGSTTKIATPSPVHGDHPHIHGEHHQCTCSVVPSGGSPPYTWGALVANRSNRHPFRITPIYMGSTNIDFRSTGIYRDHPHIHGEHKHGSRVRQSQAGSPPYTWGAH